MYRDLSCCGVCCEKGVDRKLLVIPCFFQADAVKSSAKTSFQYWKDHEKLTPSDAAQISRGKPGNLIPRLYSDQFSEDVDAVIYGHFHTPETRPFRRSDDGKPLLYANTGSWAIDNHDKKSFIRLEGSTSSLSLCEWKWADDSNSASGGSGVEENVDTRQLPIQPEADSCKFRAEARLLPGAPHRMTPGPSIPELLPRGVQTVSSPFDPYLDPQYIDDRTATEIFRANKSVFTIPAGPALDVLLLNRGSSFALTLTYDDSDQTVTRQHVYEQIVHLFRSEFRMEVANSLEVTRGSWTAIIDGLNAAVVAALLRIIEKLGERMPASFIPPFVGAVFGVGAFLVDWYYSPPPTAKGYAICTTAGAAIAVGLAAITKKIE